MPKYFSGRVKRTPQSGLTSDRYQYLGLDQAEPNLGDPPEVDNIPPGNRYQVVSVQNYPGERYWLPVGGGVQPGSITVREEGTILPTGANAGASAGINSITDLNIKGNILTAEGYLDEFGNPGVGITITAAPIGQDHEVIFNNNGEFGAASGLSYDNTNSRVGIASTQPQETLDIDGTLFITGNVFDKEHDSGDTDQVLVKSNTGGLVWADQSGATAVAAGKTTQVQFHNDDGNLGGAAKLVYDYTNERIGIGSTQPTKLLDVLGDSKFTGRTDFDGNVHIDGVLTYEDVTNVDSIGLITARTGVRITTGGLIVAGVTTLATTRFPDSTSLYFGDDDDLEIKHDGNDSIINDNATGSLKLQQGGNTRLEVTGMGITVSGVTTTNALSVTGFVTSHLIPSPTGNFNLGSEDNRWDYVYTNNIDTGSWSPIVVDIEQLRVSGLSTFIGLTRHQDGIVVTSGVSTFGGNVKVNSGSFVEILDNRDSTGSTVGALVVHGGVGISKLSNFGEGINVIGHTELDDVNISGIVTAAKLDVGISTLGIASATDLFVSGFSTFVGFSTFITGIHVTGFSTFVGFSTFKDIIVGGMSTFVGISSFEGNVSFNAGIRDKDGDLGGPTNGYLLESRNSKVNWVNPQGLTVANADKVGLGSVYGGPPQTVAGINTYFVTFAPNNNPIDARENEELFTTGLFVYDPIGQRVGIGTTVPSDTLNVVGVSSFNGEVYFNTVDDNNVAITSIGWNPSSSALEFKDNVKAIFGDASSDGIRVALEIFNNGTNSFIRERSNTGNLSLQAEVNSNIEIIPRTGNNNHLANFDMDGGVELFYQGTETPGVKFQTSGIGITVTGLTSTTSLSVSGPFYDKDNSFGNDIGYILQTNQASGVSWVNPTDLAFEKANKIGIGSINAEATGIGTHFITFVDTNNPHDGRDYELLYSTGLFVYDPQDGGRIGIGTTIPSDTLSVTGISSFKGDVYFNGLSGIASITFDQSDTNDPVYDPNETYEINVTNIGSGAYTLSGTDRNGTVSGNNQTVTIRNGDTLKFIVNANGHPFWVKTAASTGTGNAASGVTNNGAQTGAVSFTPTGSGAVGTYYYICQYHGSMVGTITVNVNNPNENSALKFVDNARLKFGDGSDLQIYHNPAADGVSEQSWIRDVGGGYLNLDTDGPAVRIMSDGMWATGKMAAFNKDASVDLYYNNAEKFATSGIGITVYGSIAIHDSDNTHKITLQPPTTGNLTADYTLTLPPNDGGSNEVLTTDGAGILSWTTKAAGTAVAAGSNKQIQYNNNNVLAGASELLFDNSTTTPTLILSPNVTTTSTNGGYIEVRNAGSNNTLNSTKISSDGGLELKRTNETTASGGPYIDFKYDATDMDARIQMDIVGGTTSDDKFSSIQFATGGGGIYDSANNPNGRLTEKLRIGKDGEIGIQGGNQLYVSEGANPPVKTNDRSSTDIYGTNGQVLKSGGLGASVYWDDESGGSGGGLAAVDVKQYSDDLSQNDPRTERSCDAPITVATSGNTATIGIGSTSNAYGSRYIGDTEPTVGLCEGDIWYDTSASGGVSDSTGTTKVAILRDQKNYDKDGGYFYGDYWRDRDLTVIEDPQGFVTFVPTANGQTTESLGKTPGYWSLPAGTYEIQWGAGGFNVNRHQTRLVWSTTESDMTWSSDSNNNTADNPPDETSRFGNNGCFGSSENSSEQSVSTWSGAWSKGTKVITITETTYFKVLHIGGQDDAEGFGTKVDSPNFSPDRYTTGKNIYAEVRIEDLATAVKEPTISNNVYFVQKTGTQTITGTGWTEVSDLTQTITSPTATTKYLITVVLNGATDNNGASYEHDSLARLVRTTGGVDTVIGSGSGDTNGFGQSGGQIGYYEIQSMNLTYLDTPGVGTHTYHVKGRATNTNHNMLINTRGAGGYSTYSQMSIQQFS